MKDHLKQLREFYTEKLVNECLPFWMASAIDHENGGFMTALDQDGSVVDTDKSVWHQGRFTWLLAELFNEPYFENHPARNQWIEAAKHGADFMERFCFDQADGRMWFHLDQKGNPIRKRRYAFSESFAAIAFGELAKALNDQHFQELAIQCFQRFVNHEQAEGVEPKFTDQRKLHSIGQPMITIATAQELRESIGFDSANQIIHSAISKIETDFVKSDLKCVMENVGESGQVVDHFDGRTLNPGHAIEAAWFIIEEGRIQDNSKWIELGCQMFDWMFDRGWDAKYGGLLYFVDVKGLPVQEYWHDMKFWWPHNEAIIAALLAFECTGNQHYLELHRTIHDWSYSHFQDDVHGEWFGYLHRDGSQSVSLKGNLWKGPFHYPRMLLTCIRILNRLLSK